MKQTKIKIINQCGTIRITKIRGERTMFNELGEVTGTIEAIKKVIQLRGREVTGAIMMQTRDIHREAIEEIEIIGTIEEIITVRAEMVMAIEQITITITTTMIEMEIGEITIKMETTEMRMMGHSKKETTAIITIIITGKAMGEEQAILEAIDPMEEATIKTIILEEIPTTTARTIVIINLVELVTTRIWDKRKGMSKNLRNPSV